MKKIAYIFISLFILSTPLFSQGEVDALRFSREDLYGTARAMSMGGAFGALGGDMTGVMINPAGIGVYRSSEVSGTLNLSRERSSVGDINKDRHPFNLDNLGFVGYFPSRSDIFQVINFGFSYNRVKSFDKSISAAGQSYGTLLDFIHEDYIDRLASGSISSPGDLEWIEDKQNPFQSQPWLQTLARNAFLLYPDQNGNNLVPIDTRGENAVSSIQMREKGYLDVYDFTIGTSINNVLNLGATLTIRDVYYSLGSQFDEDFEKGGYTLKNSLKVTGTGVSAKLGAIYRPIHSLRIGLAWHTPTRYAMSEIYEAEMLESVKPYLPDYVNYVEGGIYSGRFRNEYDLKTPGKLVASVATVLGSSFIASVDYELVNYSNMRLRVPSNSMSDANWYSLDNQYISEDHKSASTIKVGTEYRFTPQFSVRLGYAWMENPYKDDGALAKLGDAYFNYSSNTIFRVEGDTNYFTGGLGYRFNRNFYLDMAVVYKTQKDKLYPFPNYYVDGDLAVDAAPFNLKNKNIRGLLTLGYRF